LVSSHHPDPAGIMTSVPGVGLINATQILTRLGDPARFKSLPGARSFTGLVPSLTASGTSGHRQRIHVGLPHAGRIVTIELGDTTLRVIDGSGELLTTVPRNSTGEISRFKAYGTRHSH
jgi:hypothetical protein